MSKIRARVQSPAGHHRRHSSGPVAGRSRPHRSLPHRATPAIAYSACPNAHPGTTSGNPHDRVREDRVSKAGSVTLRHDGRLHHMGIGRTYAGTYVLLMVEERDIRIIHAATGEILRELTLDRSKDYQPTGRPPGPTPGKTKTRTHFRRSGSFRCPETSQRRADRI